MDSYATFDRIESDGSMEQATPPTFLTLPLELRQYMYDYVFHGRECKTLGSCKCGDSLSITNRQLYQETRPLVYKCAKPRLLDVESCLRFLQDIKDNVVHLKSLLIVDRELSSQSYRLADVFRHKGLEGLEEFHFVMKSRLLRRVSRRTVEHREPPVYSLFEERHSPAAVYDMDLRVSRHPLVGMKHLRRLTIEGYPQSDIEEAIFKASRNIEELGRREGKTVNRWEKEGDDVYKDPPNDWIYSISIVD